MGKPLSRANLILFLLLVHHRTSTAAPPIRDHSIDPFGCRLTARAGLWLQHNAGLLLQHHGGAAEAEGRVDVG